LFVIPRCRAIQYDKTLLKTTRGLSVLNTGGYLIVVIAGSFFGYMVSAWLWDRLGLQANGRAFSPVGAFFTELFPSRLCDSGQGFSYNFGRGIGALFPAGRLLERPHGLRARYLAVFSPSLSDDGFCGIGLLP
jgi:hypothetical protein